MPTIEKKPRTSQPNEFLIAARIDRLLEPLSKREQKWIIEWLMAKYTPWQVRVIGNVPMSDDTSRGPDRINPIAQ